MIQPKLAEKGVARRGKIGRCYRRITFASRENPPSQNVEKRKHLRSLAQKIEINGPKGKSPIFYISTKLLHFDLQ